MVAAWGVGDPLENKGYWVRRGREKFNKVKQKVINLFEHEIREATETNIFVLLSLKYEFQQIKQYNVLFSPLTLLGIRPIESTLQTQPLPFKPHHCLYYCSCSPSNHSFTTPLKCS